MKKLLFALLLMLLGTPQISQAAEAKLFLFSGSGAYSIAKDLPIKLMVNSGGEQGINAAESIISFNPKDITVKKIDLNGSIFNLWAIKPKINNTKGTISFSGGTTKSYKGLGGTIFTIIFSPKKITSTSIKLSTTTSQVLASDGWATNILKKTANGSYSIVSKGNFTKFDAARSQARGKVLINDKQKTKLSYVNPTDRLRYDFATSTELEQLYKRFSQNVTAPYIKKYEKIKFPAANAGRFLNTKTGTTTAYYYIGPITRKIYKLNNAAAAYKTFQSIGATMSWAEISRMPDGFY